MGVRLKADLDPPARNLVLADIDKCPVLVMSSASKMMVKHTAEEVEVSNPHPCWRGRGWLQC